MRCDRTILPDLDWKLRSKPPDYEFTQDYAKLAAIMTLSRDIELQLKFENQRAVVSPFGAALRRYWIEKPDGSTRDVIWGYSGYDEKRGGQGDVLLPFPGRLRGGRYVFEGQPYQFEPNDKAGPNAIHGFGRSVQWKGRQNDRAAQFRLLLKEGAFDVRGYPFALDIGFAYELGEDGLTCTFSVINTGERSAPFGVGFHPYFVAGTTRVDELELELPATRNLELGTDLLPTGRLTELEGTEHDFARPKRIGATRFNHCLTGLRRDEHQRAHARVSGPAGITTLWMDECYDWLVVYTGDDIAGPRARRALAIEPMTCGTDAFNHPQRGLKILPPGDSFVARWGIRATDGDTDSLLAR